MKTLIVQNLETGVVTAFKNKSNFRETYNINKNTLDSFIKQKPKGILKKRFKLISYE